VNEQIARLILLPSTAEVNSKGHLIIGGCDTVELTTEFGTPLYLFDESSLRSRCAEFKAEFHKRFEDTAILYACKAFLNKALITLFMEEGLGMDVVSGGEIGIARSVGFPMNKVCFPGNNKSTEELVLALEAGVGRIVVDNFHELETLGKVARTKGSNADILIRISPGVDPNTHRYITTGNVDSKFGFPMVKGEEAVVKAMSMPEINLMGLHFHIGSQIFETEPFQQAVEIMIKFAADMNRKHGFMLKELSVGGGYAIQYTLDAPAPPISVYAEAITSKIISQCQRFKMKLPKLIIEPGRSMVGQAGIALYTAGAVKDIPGVRCYVSVDGGMADNICPALYGTRLEAVVANDMRKQVAGEVTIAGKFCESGDILIRDIRLPRVSAGDIIAVAGCGAYSLPKAANYNAFLRPAVVLVKEGKARLIRSRETLEDLTRHDII